MKTDPITTREKYILQCVAQGKSTKEIASALFLSVYTVETHRKNIIKKMGAKNIIDAFVRYSNR